jgi:hypothetical protein
MRTILLVTLAVALATSQPAAAAELIHACVNTASASGHGVGGVRIVEAGQACLPNETAIQWPATSSGSGGSSKAIQFLTLVAIKGVWFASFHGSSITSFEPGVSYPMPGSGTFRTLKLNPFSNSLTGDTNVVLRLNGGDTDLSVVIPAGSTATVSVSVDVPFAEDDLVSIKMDSSASTGGDATITATLAYSLE